jgi:hypothetical protein
VRGEVVARVAEGADPELAVEIHARVRVEARRAALAPHGVVRHDGHLGQVFPGGHERAEGHDALRGLDLAVRPDVPVLGDRAKGVAVRFDGSRLELRAPPRTARVSPVTAVTTFRRTRRDRVCAEAPRSIGDTTAYHDRRTPSTASRAPQSGVCIAPSLRRARRSQTSTPRLSARRRDPGVLKTSPRRRLDRARSVAREDRATSRRACASSTRARVSAAQAAEADRR